MATDLSKVPYRINMSLGEYEAYNQFMDRRLYLDQVIEEVDCELGASISSQIVESIFDINRMDRENGVKPEERKPIRLYINSPGGSVLNGFAIAKAIETSATPIYTINVGEWSSAAFLIGITGHKRFSLPDMVFLMHDGFMITCDSSSKAQDKVEFNKRFESEVVKEHVLKYGNMSSEKYDELSRVEYYMLPKDALKWGFIDEIVTSLDEIL